MDGAFSSHRYFAFDNVLHYVGPFGRWQHRLLLMCGLLAAGEAIITWMYYFIGYMPDDYRQGKHFSGLSVF